MRKMNIFALSRPGLSGIFLIPICCSTLAQTSWKAEHCHNIATASEPAGQKVVIDDVVLDGTTDVAEAVWKQIVSEAKGDTLYGEGWVEELTEVRLRGGLQDQGYFKPNVSAEAKVVSSSPALQHVVVHARVRGGNRYALSGIRFRHVDPDRHLSFSAEELRTLVSLHDGDVFSVEKVRKGIDSVASYYRSHGYIDCVPTPETDIDEMHQQIALVMMLDEGVQYRLGNIEIEGLNPTLEKELRSKIKPGEVVNVQLIADFYQDHRSELPEDVEPEDTALHRNVKERIVDAFFDFRSCSQLHN